MLTTVDIKVTWIMIKPNTQLSSKVDLTDERGKPQRGLIIFFFPQVHNQNALVQILALKPESFRVSFPVSPENKGRSGE